MQTSNRLLDDLARMANGALGTAAGLKGEIEALVRDRLQRLLADMNLVNREEFDAVKAMAAKARTEQDALAGRIAALEKAAQAKPKRRAAKRARKASPTVGKAD